MGIRQRRDMEKLLTLKEVCDLIGSRDPKGRQVRELRKKGIIEGAKFGRQLMFKESSVRDYIEKTFKQQNMYEKRDPKAPKRREVHLTSSQLYHRKGEI